jgi:hypothetical protein
MKLTQYLNKSLEAAQQAEYQQSIDDKLVSLFSGKPFYCWEDKEHKDNCCFNHIIGLPVKDGREYPLFDYEQDIINMLEDTTAPESMKHKHLWIKKSTGLGISELILRYSLGHFCMTSLLIESGNPAGIFFIPLHTIRFLYKLQLKRVK